MSNWTVFTTPTPSVTLPAQGDGTYQLQVVAIDAFGNRSEVVSGERNVDTGAVGSVLEGESVEPVGSVGVNRLGNGRLLATWSPPQTRGLLVAVRHSSRRDATWGTSNPFFAERMWVSSDGSAELPLLGGTFLFRHVAPNGEMSRVSRQWVVDDGNPLMEIGSTVLENFEFAGEKSNCMNDPLELGLSLTRLRWDDLPSPLASLANPIDTYGARTVDDRLWDDLPEDLSSLTAPIDTYGVDARQGIYTFSQEVAFANAKTVEIQREISSRCIYREKLWDQFQGLVDDIPSMESPAEAGYVLLEFRSRPSAADSWSEWQPLTRSEAYGQAFQFRAQIFSGDINQDVVISSLAAILYVQRANLLPAEEQTTISLTVAPGATATGTITLPMRCILLTIATNAALWLRIYNSQAALAQDSARVISSPPELAAGVIADPVFAAPGTMQLEPVLNALNRETPRSNNFPYRITNNSLLTNLQVVVTHYPI